jgi:hypothetical protein
VQVLLTLHPGGRVLLEASVSAAGKRKLYLIDPQGGSLTVIPEGWEGAAAEADTEAREESEPPTDQAVETA